MTLYHKLNVFHKRHAKAQSCQFAALPTERTSHRHSQFEGNTYDKTQTDTDMEKSWWHHYKSRKISGAPVQYTTHKILPISRLAVSKCKPPTLKRTPSYRDLNDTMHKVWAGWRSRYSEWLRAERSGGSNPSGGEIFRTCPDRPWAPPSLLYNGYWVFPGIKSGRGVTLNPHPF